MSENSIKEHCGYCRAQTNQEIIYRGTSNHSMICVSEEHNAWFSTHSDYLIYKCLGCEHITLKKAFYDSDFNPYFGDTLEYSYFPPKIYKESPKWISHIKPEYRDLLEEIYTALANKTKRLALMGCRTVIDMYLNDKVGDIGGFNKKINVLYEKRFLSEPHKHVLLSVIDAGNAASHRGYNPDEGILIMVVDIIENLLHQTVLERTVNSIQDKTPSRE